MSKQLVIEMHEAIINIAGPPSWKMNRKKWLHEAAARAGISGRSATGLFYCEYENPRASLVERVREASRMADKERAASKISDNERIARLEREMGIGLSSQADTRPASRAS